MKWEQREPEGWKFKTPNFEIVVWKFDEDQYYWSMDAGENEIFEEETTSMKAAKQAAEAKLLEMFRELGDALGYEVE